MPASDVSFINQGTPIAWHRFSERTKFFVYDDILQKKTNDLKSFEQSRSFMNYLRL